MASKVRTPVVYPKNVKVHVTSLANNHREIKTLFHNILADYVERFHLEVTQEKVMVEFCLIQMDDDAPTSGLTIWCEPIEGEFEIGRARNFNKILVQVRDPWIENWEPNVYTQHAYVEILCHEMVHVCQKLTGRKGFKVQGAHWDKKDHRECYYFDPVEIEARCLSGLYAEKYGEDIL
jgi:hypothetical protein